MTTVASASHTERRTPSLVAGSLVLGVYLVAKGTVNLLT
jgi:hypothetical protein